MIQQVGYFISLCFAILGGILFLTGIYVGYKNYMQLPYGGESGYKYFFFGIVSFSLALFVFLTVEMGFSWGNLGFSVGLTIFMTLMLKLDEIIRRKTAIYLAKRDALSPLSSMNKLIELYKQFSNKKSDPKKEK